MNALERNAIWVVALIMAGVVLLLARAPKRTVDRLTPPTTGWAVRR